MSDEKRAPERAQVRQDSHVEIELINEEGGRERMEFDLVADKAADFEHGRIGVSAPLAKAIRGKFAGSIVEYVKGDIRQVHILSVKPLQGKVTDDAEARRQAILEEAVRQAELTNTQMFAASYTGKWGDYDVSDSSSKNEDAKDE